MSLHSRWYLSSFARLSTLAGDGRRGFAAAALKHIPRRVGQWTGFLQVPGIGGGVFAVTYDDAIVDPTAIAADFAALRAAPDAEVFDLREALATSGTTWARRAEFLTAVDERLVDVQRLADPAKPVRYFLQETARTLLLYQRLGPFFFPAPLDAQLGLLPRVSRFAMFDQLAEAGFPSAKMPTATTTFRAAYRAFLEDPFADFGIASGEFHLGRRETHLGG